MTSACYLSVVSVKLSFALKKKIILSYFELSIAIVLNGARSTGDSLVYISCYEITTSRRK